MLSQIEKTAKTHVRRAGLRRRVSDAVNRIHGRMLEKYDLRLPAGRHAHNLLTTFRRLQLTFIEGYFVQALKRKRRTRTRPRVSLDVSGLVRASARRRWLRLPSELPRLSLGLGLLSALAGVFAPVKKVVRRLQLRALKKRKGRRVPTARISRVVFVDAGEMKRSHIEGKPYLYHKYLEGLVDFQSMEIPRDTLVVLYGSLDIVDNTRLEHPRVLLLDCFRDPGPRPHVGPLIEGLIWEGGYGSGGLESGFATALEKNRALFELLTGHDLDLVTCADAIVSQFREPVEIHLDNFDSTLFALSQYLLEHYPQHTVVGVQRVLGPYTFSYNLNELAGAVRQPHRILTWGRFHERQIRSLGYTCETESSCMFKLRPYAAFRDLDRGALRQRLVLPLDLPVVMVSVVQSILGFPLVDPLEYVRFLEALADLANRDACFVLFKPWPGQDPRSILDLATPYFKKNYTLFHSAFNEPFHNVELLRACDVQISTVSSFIGEAWYFGVVPILMDTPASRAYFSAAYTRRFREICHPSRGDVVETLEAVLALSPEQRDAWFERSKPAFADVFGEVS